MNWNPVLYNDSLLTDLPLSCTPRFKSSAHLSACGDFITPTILASVLKFRKKRVEQTRGRLSARIKLTVHGCLISGLVR